MKPQSFVGGPLEVLWDLAGPIEQWLGRITESQPRAVVTRARKGTRLLEVLHHYVVENPIPTELVTSDLALPFESVADWAGHHVAVVDDIVIWGTAMRAQKEALERVGIRPECFCLALDEEHAGWLTPDHVLDVRREGTKAFCSSVVRAIGLLCKPYDLEHPILRTPFHFTKSRISATTLPQLAQLHDLTFTSQEEAGLMRATIDRYPCPEAASLLYGDLGVQASPLQKVRLYGSIPDRTLMIVPMFLFGWSHDVPGACRAGRVFSPLLEPLNELLVDAADIVSSNDAFASRGAAALTRLSAFLASYVLGYRTSAQLLERLDCGFLPTDDVPTLDFQDLRVLFGPTLGKRLKEALDRRATADAIDVWYESTTLPRQGDLFHARQKPNRLQIGMDEHWETFCARVHAEADLTRGLESVLLSVCRIMRELYDIGTGA